MPSFPISFFIALCWLQNENRQNRLEQEREHMRQFTDCEPDPEVRPRSGGELRGDTSQQ